MMVPLPDGTFDRQISDFSWKLFFCMMDNTDIKAGVVFIRHGQKAWNNGTFVDGQRNFDPHLIDFAWLDKTKAQLPLPHTIICSPFLRCRQTANYLVPPGMTIITDNNLREYLGNWQGRTDRSGKPIKMHFDRTTWSLINQEQLIESMDEFKARVARFDYRKLAPGTWVVTHGLVIETLTGHKVDEGGYVIV